MSYRVCRLYKPKIMQFTRAARRHGMPRFHMWIWTWTHYIFFSDTITWHYRFRLYEGRSTSTNFQYFWKLIWDFSMVCQNASFDTSHDYFGNIIFKLLNRGCQTLKSDCTNNIRHKKKSRPRAFECPVKQNFTKKSPHPKTYDNKIRNNMNELIRIPSFI